VKDTVFVFARAPRLGAVKRRLSRDIGERAALRFYTRSLARTLRLLAADRRFRTVVAVTPDAARGRWLQGLPAIAQGRGDLGQRMERIFRCHPHGKVAIVGSDIPGLRADDVARAFAALGRGQACFGPALDGGYWLVAMSPRRPARPFRLVRWSSENALADTLANFAGRRVTMLRTLRDVDTLADLLVLDESRYPKRQ
jgi:rSAM/selenodomain-associated transferase 1